MNCCAILAVKICNCVSAQASAECLDFVITVGKRSVDSRTAASAIVVFFILFLGHNNQILVSRDTVGVVRWIVAFECHYLLESPALGECADHLSELLGARLKNAMEKGILGRGIQIRFYKAMSS